MLEVEKYSTDKSGNAKVNRKRENETRAPRSHLWQACQLRFSLVTCRYANRLGGRGHTSWRGDARVVTEPPEPLPLRTSPYHFRVRCSDLAGASYQGRSRKDVAGFF